MMTILCYFFIFFLDIRCLPALDRSYLYGVYLYVCQFLSATWFCSAAIRYVSVCLSLSLSLCMFSFFSTRTRKDIVTLISTKSVFSQKKLINLIAFLFRFHTKYCDCVFKMSTLKRFTFWFLHNGIVCIWSCWWLKLVFRSAIRLPKKMYQFLYNFCACVCVCVCIDNRKLNWVSVIENKIYDFFLIRTIHHVSAHKWLVYLDFISCVILSHFFPSSFSLCCLFICLFLFFFSSFCAFRLFVQSFAPLVFFILFLCVPALSPCSTIYIKGWSITMNIKF